MLSQITHTNNCSISSFFLLGAFKNLFSRRNTWRSSFDTNASNATNATNGMIQKFFALLKRFGLHHNWCITCLLLHLSFTDLTYSIVGPTSTLIFYIKRFWSMRAFIILNWPGHFPLKIDWPRPR